MFTSSRKPIRPARAADVLRRDLVVVCDARGFIVYADRCAKQMLGAQVGQPVEDLVDTGSRAKFGGLLEHVQDQVVDNYELVLLSHGEPTLYLVGAVASAGLVTLVASRTPADYAGMQVELERAFDELGTHLRESERQKRAVEAAHAELLRDHERRLKLLGMGRKLSAETEPEAVLQSLAHDVCVLVDGEVGASFRWHPLSQTLARSLSVGSDDPAALAWLTSLSEDAARTSTQLVAALPENLRGRRADTAVATPLRQKMAVEAVVSVILPAAASNSAFGVATANGVPVATLGALELLAELGAAALTRAERAKEVRNLADTDPLTGLANRRVGALVLDRLLALANRERRSVALSIVDVDHFKQVNDRFGHANGDFVLQGLANLLASSVRSSDIAARWGGEEFLLVLYGAEADVMTDRLTDIQNRLRGLKFGKAGELPSVTFSAGLAVYPADGTCLDELFSAADGALYRAKAAGRDRVERFQRDTPEVAA